MIVVLDASAAVKLVLDEERSDQVRRIWDEPLRILAPTIVLAEVAAAIDAAQRGGRLEPPAGAMAQRSWVSVVDEVDLVSVDVALGERARELAADRPVRGMDAVYLALAIDTARHGSAGLLSFDRRQREVLRPTDGVALLPAEVL